jgi:hypothetical protein
MAQEPKHEVLKLQGPEQKMIKLVRQAALSKPWRRRRQGPTCIREQVNNWPWSVVERTGAELGRNGPRPAQPVFVSVRDALWPTCSSINCLCLRRPPHWSIHQRVANTKEKHREEADSRHESSTLPKRWLRLDPSRHGWPYVVKPWWSSGAMPWIHQGTCTFDRDINLILSLLLVYFDAYPLSFMCVASIWP